MSDGCAILLCACSPSGNTMAVQATDSGVGRIGQRDEAMYNRRVGGSGVAAINYLW